MNLNTLDLLYIEGVKQKMREPKLEALKKYFIKHSN
jgi:hypothetical protein